MAFALTCQDAKASDHVIEDDVLVYDIPAKCLFDSGSSYSFISQSFASKLGVDPTVIDAALSVDIPLGESQEIE